MINQSMLQLQSLFQFETYGGATSPEFHVFIEILRQLGWAELLSCSVFRISLSVWVKWRVQFNILTQQSQLLGQSDWSNLTLWEPNILLTFTFRQLEENWQISQLSTSPRPGVRIEISANMRGERTGWTGCVTGLRSDPKWSHAARCDRVGQRCCDTAGHAESSSASTPAQSF